MIRLCQFTGGGSSKVKGGRRELQVREAGRQCTGGGRFWPPCPSPPPPHLIDVVNTIWEKTDQCCPYGNSTPGHSSMKMNQFRLSLPLLIVGAFEKMSVEYTFPHFLPFNLLSKSLISGDSQWLAKLVLVVQLWSLHKISGQKKNFVEGESWTVGGVWLHGHCARLEISSSLGSSPGWGHCAVFWDTTLTL